MYENVIFFYKNARTVSTNKGIEQFWLTVVLYTQTHFILLEHLQLITFIIINRHIVLCQYPREELRVHLYFQQ